MTFDLPLIWAILIAVAILAYLLLDGFDLGVGILFPLLKTKQDREQAMSSIAPFWDGNETWLILGGGGLFAVFPLAYSLILPALYIPIMAMLFGLIFRGVAFEFRWQDIRWQKHWDISFCGGSLVAAFAQGVILGALVQGINVSGRTYAGGTLDWLTPFSLTCGGALVVAYVLLGAAWLILKTEDALRQQAYRLACFAGVGMAFFIVVVSVWTPTLNEKFLVRWVSPPSVYYVMIVPALTLALFVGLGRSLIKKHNDLLPFIFAQGLFLACYIGLGISLFPLIVPPDITIWQAAAPQKSLEFLLIGTVFLLPMILAYTAYSYWIFRGKIRQNESYESLQ